MLFYIYYSSKSLISGIKKKILKKYFRHSLVSSYSPNLYYAHNTEVILTNLYINILYLKEILSLTTTNSEINTSYFRIGHISQIILTEYTRTLLSPKLCVLPHVHQQSSSGYRTNLLTPSEKC